MKKLLALCIALCMFFPAVTLQAAPAYTFDFSRVPVTSMAYDGSVFVSLHQNGLLSVSNDFKTWYSSFPPALAQAASSLLFYQDGRFVILTPGVSFLSTDGKDWAAKENNLPTDAHLSFFKKAAQTSAGILVCADSAGTFFTEDGVHFTKVENIPDGAPMKAVNNRFVIESRDYMEGIYVSLDGKTFTRLPIVQGTELVYYNRTYYALKADDPSVLYASSDLQDWVQSSRNPDSLYPYNSIILTINGVETAFNIDGQKLIYQDGWQDSETICDKFASYALANGGLLCWNAASRFFTSDFVNYVRSDYAAPLLTQVKTNKEGFALRLENGKTYFSKDGVSFAEVPFDAALWQTNAPHLSDTNGSVTLTSENNDYGKMAGWEDRPNTKAEWIDSSGQVKTVIYENSRSGSMEVWGGNGCFLLKDGQTFLSPDGITRYALPGDRQAFLSGDTLLFQDTWQVFQAIPYREMLAQLEAPTVTVQLNGDYLSFETPPVIREDRTMIPLRFLFERSGATVDWEPDTQTAVISYGGQTVRASIGNKTVTVNGSPKQMDVAPLLVNGKTMVPLFFLSEGLGFRVDWDGDARCVSVSTPA